MLVTTSNLLENYTIKEYLGIVRGIIVRSPSIKQGVFGAIENVFGGNISNYTQMCESSRQEAFDMMTQHAKEMGADAVIGMRYEATELRPNVTEVLCYGTAIKISRQ